MRPRKNRSPALATISVALLGATLLGCVGLVGCVADVTDTDGEGAIASAPPGPTMNHAAHMRMNIECADCHDPDGTGSPAIPGPDTCFDCHDEDIASGPEKIRDYFAASRQSDGTIRFPELSYSPDLVFDHQVHGARGVSCEQCHGRPTERRFGRRPMFELKQSCMDCHAQSGASNDCAVCHAEIRKDKAPPSHTDDFSLFHGREAPKDWREGDGGLCALCHTVPRSCNDCHRENMPSSHRSPAFRLNHGRSADAQDKPFTESSCSLCHEEQACVRCHQTEMPRSHTSTFRRRLHGIAADVERESCRTCHKQSYCDRCHNETKPISHRGSFGSGRQTHCIACHDPLPMNGCYTCHKNTLGHLTATPLPPGLPHSAATDCRTCHSILPHLDDGGSCRRCHR